MPRHPRLDPDSLDNRDPEVIRRVMAVLDPLLARFYSPSVRGLARIPAGAALYVANHNGGVLMPDAWAVASAIFRERGLDDLPYALAHDILLRIGPLNHLFGSIGAVRAGEDVATRIFARGKKALAFPGGDLESLRAFRDRDRIVFGPHRGYVALALRTGVPIVPIVTTGAHSGFLVLDDGRWIAERLGLARIRIHVCPTVLSIPWGLTIGFPPPYLPVPMHMISEVLPPIRFERVGHEASRDAPWVEACHARVVATMQDALTRLAHERRQERRERVTARAHEVVDHGIEWLFGAPRSAASERGSAANDAPAARA